MPLLTLKPQTPSRPKDPAAFRTATWEQRPRVFKATPERVAFFQGLLSLPHYLDLARRREASRKGPFQCALDVNAARYRQGRRETLTVEVRGSIDQSIGLIRLVRLHRLETFSPNGYV